MGPAVHRSQDRPHSPVGRPLVGRRVRNRNVVVHDAPEVPDPAEVIRGLQTALKASHAQLRHLTSVVIQLKQDLRARTQRREMALQRSLSLSAMSSEPWRVVQAPPPALVDATAVAESNPRADAEAQTDEYVPDSDTSAPEATPKQRRKSRWATATAEAGCQAAPPVACAAQQCDAARCRDWGTQWEDPNAPVERNSLELRRLYDRIMGDDGGPRPDVAPEAAQSGTPRRCSRSGSPRPGPPREPEGVPAAGPTAPSASPELSIPGVPPLPRPSVQVDSVHGSDPSPPDSSRSPSPSPTSSRCPPDSERGFSPAELPAPDSDRRFAPLGLAPPPAAPTRLRSPRILPHALSFDSTDLEFTPLAAAVTSSTGVTPLAPVRPVAVVSVGSQTDGVALSSYRSQSVLAELKAGAALFDESESSVRSDEEQWEEELRKKPPPTDIHFLPTLLRQIHRRVRKFYWLTFLYLQDRSYPFVDQWVSHRQLRDGWDDFTTRQEGKKQIFEEQIKAAIDDDDTERWCCANEEYDLLHNSVIAFLSKTWLVISESRSGAKRKPALQLAPLSTLDPCVMIPEPDVQVLRAKGRAQQPVPK